MPRPIPAHAAEVAELRCPIPDRTDRPIKIIRPGLPEPAKLRIEERKPPLPVPVRWRIVFKREYRVRRPHYSVAGLLPIAFIILKADTERVRKERDVLLHGIRDRLGSHYHQFMVPALGPDSVADRDIHRPPL